MRRSACEMKKYGIHGWSKAFRPIKIKSPDRQTDRKQLSSQNSQTGEVVSQNRQSEEGIEEVIIMLYDGYYDQNDENGENMLL